MQNVKIVISSTEDGIVIIPMEYDKESDSLDIKEIQIEPEDLKQDSVVSLLATLILNTFNNAVC